jgi:hypothetical protein
MAKVPAGVLTSRTPLFILYPCYKGTDHLQKAISLNTVALGIKFKHEF